MLALVARSGQRDVRQETHPCLPLALPNSRQAMRPKQSFQKPNSFYCVIITPLRWTRWQVTRTLMRRCGVAF